MSSPESSNNIELPIVEQKTARCVGCQFTKEDFDASPALRALLEGEGCAEDCPILHAPEPTPRNSPASPVHKSLS